MRLDDVHLTDVPREGFTAWCAKRFDVAVPLDEVLSDREARALVARGDLLSALEGVRRAQSNAAIRRAVTL